MLSKNERKRSPAGDFTVKTIGNKIETIKKDIESVQKELETIIKSHKQVKIVKIVKKDSRKSPDKKCAKTSLCACPGVRCMVKQKCRGKTKCPWSKAKMAKYEKKQSKMVKEKPSV